MVSHLLNNKFSKEIIINHFCNVISRIIIDLEYNGLTKSSSKFDQFYLANKYLQQINFREYFMNVVEIINPEISTLVIAFIYVDRLCINNIKVFKRKNLQKYIF